LELQITVVFPEFTTMLMSVADSTILYSRSIMLKRLGLLIN